MPLSMDRWIGKVAIVTGASAGIGAAISVQLAEAGLKVVGLARRPDRIQNLAQTISGNKFGKIYAVKADISKEQDILDAFKWIKDNLGPVHILINNAGVLRPTNLVEGDTAQWKMVFDVNVMGLCIATREAVKNMRENKIDGHIVHINSIAGHYVPNFPNCNVYPASKHAVTALTETLRQELTRIGTKIKITSISPGLVKTDIAIANDFTSDSEFGDAMDKLPSLSSEDIADAVLYALSTPPHVQVHELTIKPINEMF